MDISLTNQDDETKDAYSNFYSTLPSPHYDIDDDPTFAFTSQESEDTIYGEYNVATKNGVSLFQTHQTRIYPW